MPPVFDALHAVFPSFSEQPASAADEGVHSVSDAAETQLQASPDVIEAYSGRISVINAQFSAAVENTTQQQHYLDIQQQQAKHADEEALAQADIDYTPRWRQAGLPIKPSHLTLDPLLVQTGGLVNPKSVMSLYNTRNTKEVLSPLRVAEQNHVGADPHYCSLTGNLQVHNKLVPAKRRAEAGQGATWRALPQEDLKARLAASAVRRRAMTQTMPKDQWDLEKKIIDSMHHKLGFLRNPRFPSPQKRSSTAKAAAGDTLAVPAGSHITRRHASPSKTARALPQQVPFRAQPWQVLFQGHEQGKQYHQSVTVHNTSQVGQRLRLLPPSSPYFSFSGLDYLQTPGQGMVAPGMHVGVTVSFMPDALHDYDDTMVIETGQGRLEVPLRARRDPPVLTLPQQIVVGPTLVANRQVLFITCTNTGGAGQFHISREGQAPNSPSDVQDDLVQLGPFQIGPAAFALDRQEQMQLQVVFEPDILGEHSQQFTLICNNGTQSTYHLSGTGAVVQVQLGSLDGKRFTAEEVEKPIWFGEVAVGASQQRVVHVCNPTPLPLPFCWQQTDNPVSSGPQHAQHELTDGRFGAMQFHIDPAVGILEAGSEADMTLSFAPDSQHRFLSWAQLLVDTSVPGGASMPCYSQRTCEVALEGYGAACAVAVWPPLITVPGTIQLGQVIRQQLTVSNPGHAVAAVAWTSSNPAVAVEPQNADIGSGWEQLFQVHIRGSAVGQLQAQLLCAVRHGSPQMIDLTAHVIGPAVQFADPGAAFGLVQLGKQVSETVTIHNTSQHSSATWSLRVLPKHASITAASSSSVAAQQAECASGQANTALSSSETPAISITARGSGADAQHAQQAAAGSNADAQHAQQDAAGSDADAQQDAAGLSASAQHAQQAAADSTADAQHAQQAAYQGIPAALQAKEQQLLQQLHDAQVAEHSATLTDAADSTSMSAAEGAVAPTLAQNPFEGIPADEAEQERGCKVVIEPEFGTLAAGASATVQVHFYAAEEGTFDAVLELFTAGGAISHLSVTAAVVAPSLALTPNLLDLEVTHLGIPQERRLTLSNLTMLPTSFSWEAYGSGGQQIIHAIFTPTALGKAEVLIACCTDSVSPPAGFSAVSHVKGLSVAYTVQPYPPATPLPPQPPLALSSSHLATGKSGDQAPVLNTDAMVGVRVSANSVSQANRPHQGGPVTADFGHVGIGETKSLLLSICNDSPVAASVNLWLDTFQAGVVSSAKAAAARTQPHAMASAGSLMPGSSTGQKSYLTGLSSPYGMSASWAQAHSPALPLGSTAGAGGQVEGHKHHARKAGRGGTKHDSRQTLAVLTLSSEAERTRPFASPMGQLMLTQRTSQAATKQAVGDRGIAIGVGSPQGMLPPGGLFTCTLTCSSDMCGEYSDTLHVQVGDLREKKIPVHVSVTGTPLVMQLNKVLLPGFPRTHPAAQPLAQPLAGLQPKSQTALSSTGMLQSANEALPAGLALPFEQLLADTAAERCFYVFNTASLPVQVDWTFYRYGIPGPLETRASAAIQTSSSPSLAWPPPQSKVLTAHLLVDATAQTVSLSTTLVANPAVQPFVVTPSTAVISGNASARFTVAFSSADAMLHEGYLLGAQSVIAPGSRVALHCTVSEDAAEAAKAGPAPILSTGTACATAPPAGVAESCDATAAAGAHGFSSAQTSLVICRLSGGFHPHAGPPSVPLRPLKVRLHAEVIQPRLEPEFADTTDSLRFVCHVTDNPSKHPSYRQTMVLTNMHSCPLRFAVSMAGAEAGPGAGHFQIVRAACSSVSKLEGLQPKPLLASLSEANSGIRMHRGGASQDMLRLAPHEHVSVCVHYMPQLSSGLQPASYAGASSAALVSLGNRPTDTQSAGRDDTVQDESASDQVVITYSNGYRQAVPVNAQRLHPVLEASTAELHFGSVHMQSPKTLELELSNPSFVTADWSAQMQPSTVEADTVASVSFVHGGSSMKAPCHLALPRGIDKAEDRLTGLLPSIAVDAAFAASPSNGMLPGRGLAMPKKQKVLVTFAPKQLGMSKANLKVMIAEGRTIEVAVFGEGTYSQGDEFQAQLQSI